MPSALDFIVKNWPLVLVFVVSGAMLLWPLLKRRLSTAREIGTLDATRLINSENPQDQRKDTIRLDYRFNNSNSFTYRYSGYSWVAVDAFRGQFPFARTDWNRPNATQKVTFWQGKPPHECPPKIQISIIF